MIPVAPGDYSGESVLDDESAHPLDRAAASVGHNQVKEASLEDTSADSDQEHSDDSRRLSLLARGALELDLQALDPSMTTDMVSTVLDTTNNDVGEVPSLLANDPHDALRDLRVAVQHIAPLELSPDGVILPNMGTSSEVFNVFSPRELKLPEPTQRPAAQESSLKNSADASLAASRFGHYKSASPALNSLMSELEESGAEAAVMVPVVDDVPQQQSAAGPFPGYKSPSPSLNFLMSDIAAHQSTKKMGNKMPEGSVLSCNQVL